jgi:exodeoxyribonuclease-3
MTKFVSWNVNGIRAVLRKDFMEFFNAEDADVFAVQETKCQEGQVELDLPGYYQSWSYAEKKGYSGTAVFSKEKPLQVVRQIGLEVADVEGRVCACEFEKYWFVTVYSPNSQDQLQRLPIRAEWDADLTRFLDKLAKDKPVVMCGDLNVAHEPIDLHDPTGNEGHAGYTDTERDDLTKLLASGFTDTYRYLHPDTTGVYTWWSYRERGRRTNAGWRLDYFIVSNNLDSKIEKAACLTDVMGSDHCPTLLELDI